MFFSYIVPIQIALMLDFDIKPTSFHFYMVFLCQFERIRNKKIYTPKVFELNNWAYAMCMYSILYKRIKKNICDKIKVFIVALTLNKVVNSGW